MYKFFDEFDGMLSLDASFNRHSMTFIFGSEKHSFEGPRSEFGSKRVMINNFVLEYSFVWIL